MSAYTPFNPRNIPRVNLLFRAFRWESAGINGCHGCKAGRFANYTFDDIPTPEQMGWEPRRLRDEMQTHENKSSRDPTTLISLTSEFLRAVHICANRFNGTGTVIVIDPEKLGMCYQARALLERPTGYESWQDFAVWGSIPADSIVGHCSYQDMLRRGLEILTPSLFWWNSLRKWKEGPGQTITQKIMDAAVNVACGFDVEIAEDLAREMLSQRWKISGWTEMTAEIVAVEVSRQKLDQCRDKLVAMGKLRGELLEHVRVILNELEVPETLPAWSPRTSEARKNILRLFDLM